MLATCIIIFREVLEIALIITILMAASRGVPGRNKYILLGVAGGIAGAGLIAFFAEAIANAMEGMGQEIFNGIILLAATAMIGWTVVWMRSHGAQIAKHLKQIGHEVQHGEVPMYTLSIVVLLAVLREGAEIVLFTYGLLASGASLIDVSLGALLGFATGGAIGVALYAGLIRMATKHIFSVTSWLLIFLAAGMAGQAALFFSAADIIPEFSNAVWDSSAFLPEKSIPGQILHALIGYSEQPSGTQLASYLLTICLIVLCLRFFGHEPKAKPVPAK